MTGLSDRCRRALRVVAWALLALGIGCMLAAEFLDSGTRPPSNGTWWEDMLLIAAFVAFPAMGTLIALQRSDNGQEVDLEALSSDLMSVVDDTVRPSHLSLWIKPGTNA